MYTHTYMYTVYDRSAARESVKGGKKCAALSRSRGGGYSADVS